MVPSTGTTRHIRPRRDAERRVGGGHQDGLGMELGTDSNEGSDDRRLGTQLGKAAARHVRRHVARKVAIAAVPLVAILVIGIAIAAIANGLGGSNQNVTTSGISKYPSTNIIQSSCTVDASNDGSSSDNSNSSGISCKSGGSGNASSSGSSGTGQEYAAANDKQKAVADASYNVGSTGAGYCAAWVTNVFIAAGVSAPSGNAIDMYDNYCTSKDRSQLQVGMLIAVRTEDMSEAASEYGHVGIYIGDGKVRDCCSGVVRTTSLGDWINEFEPHATSGDGVKWGFGPGMP